MSLDQNAKALAYNARGIAKQLRDLTGIIKSNSVPARLRGRLNTIIDVGEQALTATTQMAELLDQNFAGDLESLLVEPAPTSALLPGQDPQTYYLLLDGKLIPARIRTESIIYTGRLATKPLGEIGLSNLIDFDELFFQGPWPHGWRILSTAAPTTLEVIDNRNWQRGNLVYRPRDDSLDKNEFVWELMLFRRYDRCIVTINDTAWVKVIDGSTQTELLDPETGEPAFPAEPFPKEDRWQLRHNRELAANWLCKHYPNWQYSYATFGWWDSLNARAQLAATTAEAD